MSVSRYLHIIAWSDSRCILVWPLAMWISSFLNKYCRLLWSLSRQQCLVSQGHIYKNVYFDNLSIKIVIIQLLSERCECDSASSRDFWNGFIYLNPGLECSSQRWAWQIFLLGPPWAGMKPLTRKNESYTSQENILLKWASVILSGETWSMKGKWWHHGYFMLVKLFFSSQVIQ